MEKLKIEYLKIEEIKPYDKNPRKNEKAVEIVAKSIKEFGFKNPIILDKNNEIVAGHTRLKAAIKLNLKEVPVVRADDLTPEQVKAFRIMDNKSSEFAEWDLELLKGELYSLEGSDVFELTGFSSEEISGIWDADKEVVEDIVEVDAYERAKSKTKVKTGEIYILGNHRLMCGDSTEKSHVGLLMGENKANMVFTDPPYGIDKEIMNDNLRGDEFKDWNRKWIRNLPEGGMVCYHSTRTFPLFLNVALEEGWDFERMLWFHRPDKFPVHTWNSWMLTSQTILLLSKGKVEYKKVSPADQDYYRYTSKDLGKKSGPPTEKIVTNCAQLIKHYNTENIYDPFGGSGSTLIACEQLDRKCFMMEIDPVYCQVIIDRWEKLTKKKAIKL